MELQTWLAFFAACWVISLSPGAGAIASMSSGLQYGFWRGYWNALGLQLGLAMQIAIVGAVLMGVNGVSQRGQALLQSGFFRLGRHDCNQTSQRLDRVLLHAKSGLVRDAARLHRVRVIRADVIEQVQRLRRTFGGSGQ